MSSTHTATTTRTYPRHDVIDAATGAVAHLSHLHQLDTYGSWYSLCGKIVPGYRVATLADTDFDTVCKGCERKAGKR